MATKDPYSSQKAYAEQMRDKGFQRFTTWVAQDDIQKVTKYTAKLRKAHEANLAKKAG